MTMPAPTVRPPSRMAKRICSSRATGVMSSIVIVMLSPGMTILVPSGSAHGAGHVRRAHVELRAVVGEERRVTAALLLLQDVDLALELRVRRHRARLGQDLAALDLVLLDAAQQNADVVARLPLVEQLAEHLHARHHRLARVA